MIMKHIILTVLLFASSYTATTASAYSTSATASFFAYKNATEGNLAFGNVAFYPELMRHMDDINTEYYKQYEIKEITTIHHYFDEIANAQLKFHFMMIQNDPLWTGLCDNHDIEQKCQLTNIHEMDELMYSYVPPNLEFNNKLNLYGDTNTLQTHKDCDLFYFPYITFYRVLVGLTPNEYITTQMVNYGIGYKIQNYEYVAFDFDKTFHQVVSGKYNRTNPRLIMKLHYIVCGGGGDGENGGGVGTVVCSKWYLSLVANFYILYYKMAREYQNQAGGIYPKTIKEFFMGLNVYYYYNTKTKTFLYKHLWLSFAIYKIFKLKSFWGTWALTLFFIYTGIVVFYWARFVIYGVR